MTQLQLRLKNNLHVQAAKIEVIEAAWKKLYFRLLHRATEIKDEGMKEIL